MKIFINPGHMPGVDSGAVNDKYGVTEAGIVKEIGAGVQQYLNRVVLEASRKSQIEPI